MLASDFDAGGSDGACGGLRDGRFHFAELGEAGDYGHGTATGRGNVAIDLGMPGHLPCHAGGWIRYQGRTTYATKADIGYGDTSKPPNSPDQRRIDLLRNLADYLGFGGLDYIEFAPNFATPGGDQPTRTSVSGYVNPLREAHVTPERIDQGVDYAGTGYYVAIGDGIVAHADPGGWGQYGAYLEYEVTQPGGLRGVRFFYAEGLDLLVGRGHTIHAGQRLAQLRQPMPYGTEVGVAAGIGTDESWARVYGGGWDGAKDSANSATRAGIAMSRLIERLGGPGGKIEGPVIGTWPPFAPGGNVATTIVAGSIGGGGGGGAVALPSVGQGVAGYLWPVDMFAASSYLAEGAVQGAKYAEDARRWADGIRYVTLPKS
jgi:hypothetical protein